MPKRVILTEKPDVAKHVAEFLGIEKKLKGAYQLKNGDYVTYNVGHLLSLGEPEKYMDDARKAARGFDQLPILPNRFQAFPDPQKLDQLKTVVRLLKEADIIVNAGDIDREGQLIADETIAYAGIDPAGNSKPVERVLIRANNKASLQVAFDLSNRRNNGESEFVYRRRAGQARAEADWLIGMNGSRGLRSALNLKTPLSLSVGRVQTPTLSLVVKRELAIRDFKPVTYYVPEVTLTDGRVLKWSGRIGEGDSRGIDDQGRIIERSVAEDIVARIRAGLEGKVSVFKAVEREQEPPLPFNLAKLQIDMSACYGLSAKTTAKAAQSLYQTHKMISYIGTDCQYLPTSMHREAPVVLKGISNAYLKLASGANPRYQYNCWNDANVSAHHAMIPTGELVHGLPDAEQKVFDAIARRFIMQFYPKHQFLDSQLEMQYSEDIFQSSWKETQVLGWKVVGEEVQEEAKAVEKMGPKLLAPRP